ncbi:hypothetical protein ABE073_03865 [Lederbergia citrisecunda]|uniref:hypothetical protein n=1 Tax=Lederbergia citrisecunda TaxID=2833583 RepID=UPI003D2B7950
MKRKLSFLLLCVLTVLVVGCNTEATSETYHDPMKAPSLLPENPIGLVNGEVSQEYFDELTIFYSRMTVYTTSEYLFRTEPQVDEDILNDDEYFANYALLLDKAEEIMSDFSIKPFSPAEKEISIVSEDYKEATRNTSEMLRRFFQTRDLTTIRGNLDLIEIEAEKEKLFYETLQKYKLTTSK